MSMISRTLGVLTAGCVFSTGAFAQNQSGGEAYNSSAFVPLKDEPAARILVDPPLPAPLARGAVLIPYRTENLRILPVLGADAAKLSPRAGHLHVTVDDLPWRWADFSDDRTIVVVGMLPGEHKILIELADPEHRVITGQAVTFTVPGPMQ